MTTTTTEDGVPVFGADADLEGTIEFAIEALHVPTGERRRHRFSAWRDPGPDFVLGFMRSGGTDEAAMSAAAQLIGRALVDSDGLSADYRPPGPGEDGKTPKPDPRLAKPERWSSARRFYALIASDDERIAAMVLVDLAGFLAREAFKRGTPVQGDGAVPTAAPARSTRGRKSTPAGSTAKRSPKA